MVSESDKKQPNILWICTDSQRWDTLGCTGNEFVRTPNVDGLADKGTLFTRTYCQNPFCMPSRASFMTGRYPRTSRVRQNGQTLPPDEVIVSRTLTDAGYLCGHIGRLHVSAGRYAERRTNDGYAFWHYSPVPFPDWRDSHDHAAVNEYTYWLRDRGITDLEPYIWNPDKPSPRIVRGCKFVQAGIETELHHTTWCAEKAIQFIEANTTIGSPWMLNLNMIAPHHPFDPPMEFLERYMENLDEVPLPNYVSGELEAKGKFQQLAHDGAYNLPGVFRYEEMSDEDHRLVRAAYWADVDLIDVQVGRILEALEKTGETNSTLIIFSSDHGEMLGDHGIYLKGPFFYDPMVRVPLIISYPGANGNKGNSNDSLVELVDIVPTLLEAAGLPRSPGIQGQSFYSTLVGTEDESAHREDVYCEHYKASNMFKEARPYLTMLRNDRYKLVVLHGEQWGELYDMESDPTETNNLWNDPDLQSTKADLVLRLCDRMAWTADPLPEREKFF